MTLTDIVSSKTCAEFAQELSFIFGMNCAVHDAAGTILSGKPNWFNRLCPKIKGNADSRTAICAPSNQHFMAAAQRTEKAVVGACDAGFMKVAVPIIAHGEFLGAAGGCGRLPANGGIETFIIEKTLTLSEKDIWNLLRGASTMTEQEANRMADFIEQRIAAFI